MATTLEGDFLLILSSFWSGFVVFSPHPRKTVNTIETKK